MIQELDIKLGLNFAKFEVEKDLCIIPYYDNEKDIIVSNTLYYNTHALFILKINIKTYTVRLYTDNANEYVNKIINIK